jgi:hypothetical protein
MKSPGGAAPSVGPRPAKHRRSSCACAAHPVADVEGGVADPGGELSEGEDGLEAGGAGDELAVALAVRQPQADAELRPDLTIS